MVKHFKSLLAWMAMRAFAVAILYFVAHVVLVKRVEPVNLTRFYERAGTWNDSIICRTGSMHYVFPAAPALLRILQWYLPLARLDNTAFIRHHRWPS
jgi:hypothetical protein